MLIELAIGDAYGAGFEYAPRAFIEREHTLRGYVQHPRHRMAPGSYTDDTQMSIAVAEALLSDEPWTPRLLAGHFLAAFKRDVREGYNGSFFSFLLKTNSADEFLQHIRPDSEKSGAAMRAAPLGVLPTEAEVIEKCRIQAAVTHNTPAGIGAATAAALASFYFIHDVGPKAEIGRWLNAKLNSRTGWTFDWNADWVGKIKGKGFMSVLAALTMIRRYDSHSAMLDAVVKFGGDVDTAAAIALGCAAHARELAADLPTTLVSGLENHTPYGREFIAGLDRQLFARFELAHLAPAAGQSNHGAAE